jgi:hypothetical protein
MNTEYILFCDEASVVPDNILSVKNIFDALNAPAYPSIHPKMTIVFLVDGEGVVPGATVGFKLKKKDSDSEVFSLKVIVPDKVNNNRYRHILGVNQVPFESEGVYEGIVSVDDIEVGKSKLFVKKSV